MKLNKLNATQGKDDKKEGIVIAGLHIKNDNVDALEDNTESS